MKNILGLLLIITMSFATCGGDSEKDKKTTDKSPEKSEVKNNKENMELIKDWHTYAEPNEARITHLDWVAAVDFENKKITATANFDITNISGTDKIVMDINDLSISKIRVDGNEVEFEIGPSADFIGQPLRIPISKDSKKVSIDYTTNSAKALLWVEGDKPFLFSQSQAILARTWIPIQDSPGIRITYNAEVTVRKDLLALMSAVNPMEKNGTGVYNFKMEQPIPAYLLALAVGDLEFRPVSDRAGVYATPDMIEKSAYEFAEMDDLIVAAEKLYGKYAWERYDLLVLPAAFPFGGMENPRLTFATPTIIAGDRSLVSLVAHELAHSWSGNLVTNSTWDDFWLNEGFTVYFEQRIMEEVYGRDISEMLAKLSLQGLIDEEEELFHGEHPEDTKLQFNLKGRDPDDGMTAIPYDKGYFFLRLIEETVGREKFDVFIKQYFEDKAFKVMDTDRFITYVKENLITEEYDKIIRMDEWIFGERIPDNIPTVKSDKIAKVDEFIASFVAGKTKASDLPWNNWVYQEKYRFLFNLPEAVTYAQMQELEDAFEISKTGNNEVLFAWLKQSVLNDYTPSYDRLEEFMVSVGRRKFIEPLYQALIDVNKKGMALDIYKKARPNYHAVATDTMDGMLY